MKHLCTASLLAWMTTCDCPMKALFSGFSTGWRNTTWHFKILADVNVILKERVLMLIEGSAVANTLNASPSSTKSTNKARHSEMHSRQIGDQWHFGMKAYMREYANFVLAHTVRCSRVVMCMPSPTGTDCYMFMRSPLELMLDIRAP